MELEWADVVLKSIFCIGLMSLVKRFMSLLTWAHSAFFRSPKDLTWYGSWAVVTGCTDGIGKALALDLAKKGLNLVLVGRNQSKLEEVRQQVNGVKVTCILVDLAETSGEEVERRVKEGIQGLDVGVLINNAGIAYPYARFFHEVDLRLMESVVGVNVSGATWVTRAVLPCMLQKGKGAIVNIGSGSSLCLPSYPLYTVYSATKAYLAMFSRSISLEYKDNGIDIQCQIPLLVATKMSSIREGSWVAPSPEEYSRASLRWVGNGAHTCMPYWTHYLQWFVVIQGLPDLVLNMLAFRYFVSMRARGMRRDARLAAAASKIS
ncbi:hypothetical protein V2J09_004169 [Rumex salicifolius]